MRIKCLQTGSIPSKTYRNDRRRYVKILSMVRFFNQHFTSIILDKLIIRHKAYPTAPDQSICLKPVIDKAVLCLKMAI